MSSRSKLFVLAAIVLILAAACQPQVELEPAQTGERGAPATTATATTAATKAVAIEEIVTATVLEPVTPSPEPGAAKESIMPVEPIEPSEASSTPAPEEPSQEPETAEAQPTAELQPAIMVWVDQAKEDLAQRQSISPDEIELLSFQSEVWPNAGMGCPQPGMMYAQVMVEGYLIRLKVGDEVYNYHGGGNRAPFLCDKSGPEIAVTKQVPKLDTKLTPTKSVPPPRK